MEGRQLLEEVRRILAKEPRLIRLPCRGKAVFVGDTHGDLEATERVISRFLNGTNTVVFLGDYVDRGDFSRENIDYLVRKKCQHPEQLILLAGNHEGYLVKPFHPANFWESLLPEEKENYGSLFSLLPLAVASSNGLLAVHGGLPDLTQLGEIDQIEWGDDQWERILWADFAEEEGEFLGDRRGRPLFGWGYFDRMMDRYERRVLIRSHQPDAPLHMFKKRCLTLFTSCAYMPDRQIAIADLQQEIRTSDDLVLDEV